MNPCPQWPSDCCPPRVPCPSNCPPATPQCGEDVQDRLTCLENQNTALIARDEWLKNRIALLEAQLPSGPFEDGIFAFLGNAGDVTANQSLCALRVQAMNADLVILGGSTQHNTESLTDSLAAFAFAHDEDKLLPCFGAMDLDTAGDGTTLVARFPDLFDGKRYYKYHSEKGNADIFVLDSGLDGSLAMVEPDGNTVGSVQYQWFVDQIAASTARWRIVVFHHPIFRAKVGGTDYPNMDWAFERFGVHLVLNAKEEGNWHIRRGGLDYVCDGVTSYAAMTMIPTVTSDPTDLIGVAKVGAYVPYLDLDGAGDTGLPAVVRITASEFRVTVDIIRAVDGTILHTFTI